MNSPSLVFARAIVAVSTLLPAALVGQAPARDGLFADAGLGFGRVWALEGNEWLNGPSGRMAIGAAVGHRWMFGIQFAGGLVTPKRDDLEAVAMLGPVVRYVIDQEGYWVLSTAVGVALMRASDEVPIRKSRDLGVSLGIGYERKLGGSFGLAPYSEVQFSGARIAGMRLALGVALAWY